MTAYFPPEHETAADSPASPNTPKNPYNTRRRSLYFSHTTHTASTPLKTDPSAPEIVTPSTTPPGISGSLKHPAHNHEHNPRSPKRLKRHSLPDRSFTPPPSPPQAMSISLIPTQDAATESLPGYDAEDDPVINAIVHVLQLADNTPLSTRDLSSSILQHRLCDLEGPNPSSVVSSRITSHLKRRAAEKPPREPLLERYESETGRKRTEYHLKLPEMVSDRSAMYPPQPVIEEHVLQATYASKLNILPYEDEEEEDVYAMDISRRSPHPTLFDPPAGVILSPIEQFDILSTNLDYHLSPAPSDSSSYPSPLDQVFSRNPSPDAENRTPSSVDEMDTVPSPPATTTDPYDSSLLYQSSRENMFQNVISLEEDDDEVHVVEVHRDASKAFHRDEDMSWATKRSGHVPSPENIGLEELEEWLEGI
jgi:hypothetical protein